MKAIENIEQLSKIFNDYFVKNTITNCYILLDEFKKLTELKKLYYIISENNACLLVNKGDFMRLYYFINNMNDIFNIDTNTPYVMEIIYRGENSKPKEIIEYWNKCGFKEHLTRDNMVATYDEINFQKPEQPELKIKTAEKDNEIFYTKSLIDETLDKFTGDILSVEEIRNFVKNGTVLCSYYNEKLSGILQYEVKNNVIWLGHIAVDSEYRGKGIAKELVKEYLIKNYNGGNTRYQLWVIKDNINATELYRKLGFKYNNKSTISMLKIN